MTSLSEEHRDFGKPRYPRVEGYALWSSRNSWPTRSSWSVVTPGSMCLPTSTMAWAAILAAIRIFSMVSADLTSDPVNLAGPGLPTYSGRGMDGGYGKLRAHCPRDKRADGCS